MFLGGYQPEGGIAAPESREYLMSEQGLRRACEEGIILEAVAVRCDLSFRLTVDLHCMNGYIRSVFADRRAGEGYCRYNAGRQSRLLQGHRLLHRKRKNRGASFKKGSTEGVR